MGKVRKNRHKKQSGSNDDKDSDDLLIERSQENAIQTILDQMQSTNIEEKYCALQTFALLLENHENVQQSLSSNVVKVAAPMLLDGAGLVRNAASGALRNLSAMGHEICDAIMDQDIMTPLTCFFHEHVDKWTPALNQTLKNDDTETIVNCMNILWNLCESSELAVKYVGQSRILEILPQFLDMVSVDITLVISTLQCLLVLVEDNPQAIDKIKTTCEKQLQTLLLLEGNDPSVLLVKTVTTGVIINLCGGDVSALPIEIVNTIVKILADTLSVDHRFACNQLSSNVPLKDAAGKVNKLKGKEAETLDKQLKSVLQLLDAQQSAVEIVANICSDGGDECSENDDSSDNEEIEDEMLNGTQCSDSVLVEDKLPTHVLEAFVTLDVFEKVWARTQLPAENIMMVLKEYEGSQLICKKLQNLQAGALLCINNMLSSLPIENLGGVNGVYKIWVDAGKLVFKQTAENLNLLESATAVMRAALDKIKFRNTGNDCQDKLFKDLALSDIEIMLNGIRECQVPEIRSNLIRMIGILALLLINNLNEETGTVICTITEFILDQANKENEVWVMAEAIDTIVDMYSEDETDVLAARIKLVDKLSSIAPILKSKARLQRNLPKEYKVLVTTATSNLPRFIKYKRSRINNIK